MYSDILGKEKESLQIKTKEMKMNGQLRNKTGHIVTGKKNTNIYSDTSVCARRGRNDII